MIFFNHNLPIFIAGASQTSKSDENEESDNTTLDFYFGILYCLLAIGIIYYFVLISIDTVACILSKF